MKDLQDKDHFKVSIADTFIKVYKDLAELYVETEQIEKSLLISERRRARALGDILNWKHNLNNSHPLRRNDVEEINIPDASCIVLYDIDIRKKAVRMWVLDGKTPPYFACQEHEPLFFSESRGESLLDEVATELHVRCIVDEDEDEDHHPLEKCFQLLIYPIRSQLTDKEKIIIIPDGHLFIAPFAAFQDPVTGKPLVETKSIRLAPSLRVFKILQESSAYYQGKVSRLFILKCL